MPVFSYLTLKAKVGVSAIDRKGIFAVKSIKKGEVICVFGGKIIIEKEFLALAKRNKFAKEYTFRIADGFYLMPPLSPKEMAKDDFFNHSCDPNAGIKGQIVMAATRDINPGEKITCDYAMTDDDRDDYLRCHCGVKNCRGAILGSDWQKPELQKRYQGYFAWHIQEKIDRLKRKTKTNVNSR